MIKEKNENNKRRKTKKEIIKENEKKEKKTKKSKIKTTENRKKMFRKRIGKQRSKTHITEPMGQPISACGGERLGAIPQLA